MTAENQLITNKLPFSRFLFPAYNSFMSPNIKEDPQIHITNGPDSTQYHGNVKMNEAFMTEYDELETINDMTRSLEKIDISMQKLIRKAQISLLPTPSIPTHSNDVCGDEYFQQDYNQSQANINVAFEQLEQSIRDYLDIDIEPTTITHIHHHHHHHHHHYKYSEEKSKSKWYIPILLSSFLVIIGYMSIQPSCKNRYGSLHLFLLLIMTLYRKQQIRNQFPVINPIDRFMIRTVFSKGTPILFGCLHRFNIVYLSANFLFF